ncbi:RNA polymerase sigma factor [Longimicrobium sp.]|uniref:RNA polymerase sigma factor n=1 Tax=Longimicrobium sp. TaxID=2029185 RepID=UPI002B5BF5E1|nr:RNA polymerase sigma factor [Longimicrobium sp.]HSU12977.1 RNA polymerase sigma factor [Longimicrobium sp.]
MRADPPVAEPLDALAARARTGDEGAFAALANAVRDQVRRWALVRTGDPDDAEDVAQNVVIRLHRSLAAFEGRSRFATWLYRLTANAATEMARGHARRTRLHDAAAVDHAGASPAMADRIGEMENARMAALVRGFFAELPGRQREVFDLVDLQGHTPAEAAEMLEIEQSTARVHLLRARRAIRERILAAHPTLMDDR